MRKFVISEKLEKEFHSGKNKFCLSGVTNSGTKIWWTCELDHEWEATIAHRLKGSGCPYCANSRVLSGFNDLKSVMPEVANLWHPTKNVLKSSDVTPFSAKNVWWLGECGHEWEAKIFSQSRRKTPCPYCTGKKLLKGFNDLATTYPALAKQWNYPKNEYKLPEQFFVGSNQKVWWVCSKKHEWESTIKNRKHRGCPYCSGRKVFVSENDLATTHPALVKQFHSTKNLKTVDSFSFGSDAKVWWVCDKGHEWEARICDRTKFNSTGCPFCTIKQSAAEREILSKLPLDIHYEISDRTVISPYELDIYIPEKRVAIEFNGVYWHNEKNKPRNYHYDKWKACKDKGIQLIQIWEDDWNKNSSLVIQMLLRKIGRNNTAKVFARNTYVVSLEQEETKRFLTENHIQGSVEGSIRFGLKDSNESLISVIVLKREPKSNGETLNLLRFATSKNVVGGFSKLLKHVKDVYDPKSIITFSDNCVSNGELYKTTGFEISKILPPDYMYVVKGERVHKFNYRLKKFKSDPNLVYKPSLSESQLATLNNLHKIWDAGKIKWVKYYD